MTPQLGCGLAIVLLAAALGASGKEPSEARGSAHGEQSEGPSNVAIFAGGCFWCMEPPFDVLPGVKSTTSGYIGGHKKSPTYEQVSSGDTGHAESVLVRFDPEKVTYEELLAAFWRNIDPFAVDYQFCDHGPQYRSAIFYSDEQQRQLAEASREVLQSKVKQKIATQIEPAGKFYPAEDYHQNYYKRNPVRYKFYRLNCGRDKRLEEVWGSSAEGR